jgi:hypothetical protein
MIKRVLENRRQRTTIKNFFIKNFIIQEGLCKAQHIKQNLTLKGEILKLIRKYAHRSGGFADFCQHPGSPG